MPREKIMEMDSPGCPFHLLSENIKIMDWHPRCFEQLVPYVRTCLWLQHFQLIYLSVLQNNGSVREWPKTMLFVVQFFSSLRGAHVMTWLVLLKFTSFFMSYYEDDAQRGYYQNEPLTSFIAIVM